MILALLLDLDALLQKADELRKPFHAKARVERRGSADRSEVADATLSADGRWRGAAVEPWMLEVWRKPWSELRETWDVRLVDAEPLRASTSLKVALKPGKSTAFADTGTLLLMTSPAGRLRVRLDAALRPVGVESDTTVITLHGVRESGVVEERR